MEFSIWLAKFGPILVKYELNVFAIKVLSAMIGVGERFFYVLERIPLIASHVFLMLFLNLLKHGS